MPGLASASGTSPVDVLAYIVEEMDPLYLPARFVLGYAHLLRGDAERAEAVFTSITTPHERMTSELVDDLRQVWIEGPRLGVLARRVPTVNRWLAFWGRTVPYVLGGRLVVGAEAWADLKKELAETPASEILQHAHRGSIAASLDLLQTSVGHVLGLETIRTAAGLTGADDRQLASARRLMDEVLDRQAIAAFDGALTVLRGECILAEVQTLAEGTAGRSADDPSRTATRARYIAQLREGQLGQVFRRVVDTLERRLEEGKWKEAQALIDELHQQSMARSDYRLRTLLDDPALDGYGAWLASWFVPAVRALRAARRELRQPLRAESIYHMALAELLSFERSRLLRARARARELRRTRLPGTETAGPAQELRLLTICLEVNCVARLLEPTGGVDPAPRDDGGDDDWHPVTAAWDVTREWPPTLRRAVQDSARAPEVRAAAHTALGLATRVERREEDAKGTRRFYDVRPNRLPQEVGHYRAALNLHETATTHCYLAECLLELRSPQEARAHVTRALALSPMHPLARRLRGSDA